MYNCRKIKKMYIFLVFLISINLFFVPKIAYALSIDWSSKEYRASARTEIDVTDSTGFKWDWKDSSEVAGPPVPITAYSGGVDHEVDTYHAGGSVESYVDDSSMNITADAYYFYPTGDSSKGWAEGNFQGIYTAEYPLLEFRYFLDGNYNALGDYALYSWLKVTDDLTTIFYDKRSITDSSIVTVFTPIGHEITVDFGIGAYVHANSSINASSGNFIMNYNAAQVQVPQVPEPCTMFLLGSLATGLFGFAGLRKRFKK